METRFLETLLIVVETASIAETSRRLNITPSAVTQRIKALESEIGRKLLQRSGHTMKPTSVTVTLIADAKKILSLESNLKAAASVGSESGLLRVGVVRAVLMGVLPDILVRLREKLPDAKVYLTLGRSGDNFSLVVDGRLDAAFIVKPHFAMPKSLDWMELRNDPYVLIAPPDMKITNLKSALRKAPFIRHDRNDWSGRLVDQYLHKLGIRPREQLESGSVEAIVKLVSHGLGVSIVPDGDPSWPQGATVSRSPLRDAPHRTIGIIWSRASPRLPFIRALVSEVSHALSD